jgi:uncharacterized RDD family membrane protein YckC
MSGLVDSSKRRPAVPTAPEEDERFVGVVTRAISWVLDAVAINVVAIGAGIGIELFVSIVPISQSLASALKPIAGAIYIIWCAAYFVVLWSWTGQTLGARVMQIRLLTARRGRVKPARAVVRWVGMNLAMLPLFAGYVPILFGRRGFPDWLAHTVVVEAPDLSLAEQRLAKTPRGATMVPSVLSRFQPSLKRAHPRRAMATVHPLVGPT